MSLVRDQKLYTGTELSAFRPDLQNIEAEIAAAKNLLAPFHKEYQQDISSGSAAASLDLAALIYACCVSVSAKRVIDLGSGFTSFVLRKYQSRSDHPVDVWSVDDSEEWLAATGRYLQSKGLSSDNLMLWDDFAASLASIAPLDLVVLDVRPISRRVEWLPRLIDSLTPQGVVIADDMHKPHMRRPTLEAVREKNAFSIDCSRLTKDSYGRFAAAIFPPQN